MPDHADSLPGEVLSEIFRLAIGNPVSFKDSDNKSRASILLVCKSWSKTLLSTKSLWSNIVIEALDSWETGVDEPGFADISFLQECLTLSYPLPITVKIHIEEDDDEREAEIVPLALELLMAHAIRWRTFSCIGPSWLFDALCGIDSLHMPRLESLTLRCKDVPPEELTEEGKDIVLSPHLTHLDINFNMPRLTPTWSGLTSFSSGFSDGFQCYETLCRLTSLVTLSILHVGNAVICARHPPIIMNNLRCLKLTKCAITYVLEFVQFPSLEELHLREASHESHYLDHDARLLCPNVKDVGGAKRLQRILQRPGTSLRVMDVSWAESLSEVVIPLLKITQNTMSDLRITFKDNSLDLIDNSLDAPSLLAFLTVDDHPVLPQLSQLHLDIGDCESERETLFKGGWLERMIVSRSHTDTDTEGRTVCSLRTLRLHRDCLCIGELEAIGDLEGNSRVEATYRHSSLALLLKDLSDSRLPFGKRLDVEWTFGDVDILTGSSSYLKRMFSGGTGVDRWFM